MSTIKVDNIQGGSRETLIPISELRHQVIKTYRFVWNGGAWGPSDAYQWAPSTYCDYTPASASSRIRFTLSMSYGHINGHGITHCIFYANGVEQGRHSIAGQSPEHRHLYVWDVASWGTSQGRIGYQMRRYGGSNSGLINGLTHWDGVGAGDTRAETEYLIEEYMPL